MDTNQDNVLIMNDVVTIDGASREVVRKPNWNDAEKLLLLSEYKKRRHFLRPRAPTTVSFQRRHELWQEIADIINDTAAFYRPVKEVQKKWQNMCTTVRSLQARQETGTPLPNDMSGIRAKLLELIDDDEDFDCGSYSDDVIITCEEGAMFDSVAPVITDVTSIEKKPVNTYRSNIYIDRDDPRHSFRDKSPMPPTQQSIPQQTAHMQSLSQIPAISSSLPTKRQFGEMTGDDVNDEMQNDVLKLKRQKLYSEIDKLELEKEKLTLEKEKIQMEKERLGLEKEKLKLEIQVFRNNLQQNFIR